MQFYRFKGVMVSADWAEVNDNRKEMRERAIKIFINSDNFNQDQHCNSYTFISDISSGTVVIGAIVRDNGNVTDLISEYLKVIGMDIKDSCTEETTLQALKSMLVSADRNHYIECDDDVLEQFDLDKISGIYSRITYGESIIDSCEKRSIYEKAERLLAKDTFIPELERIYAGKARNKAGGHPVHYIIQTDDRETRKEMCTALIQALYTNNRIHNKRYCFLEFRPGEHFSRTVYDCLYKSNVGGAIVVRYLAYDDTEDAYAGCGRYTIETLCEVMKKYKNRVLTIFCLPRECTESKDIFYENLGSTSIVELKEEFAYGECAKDFLKILAKDNGIRPDAKLFAKLDKEKGYLAPDLHNLFDDWYDNKLKTYVYPQYKNIGTVKHEIVKSAPKGSAYDELNRMIGLGEAKKVINQALNYYKAQKLFSDKGMPVAHPAMHMVFTGNPGTAKTSVARLFARIMKENNLLSKGNIIEVGRGDLVGKYVGWTAQTIQRKFKEAEGNVLFIDEAYSLVDDRDGSFGDEAINTIVQEMENHRDDMVVIFAGYPDKMEEFIKKNPGLRSRIAYYIPFSDYDTESLCEIAKLIAGQMGLTLTNEALEKLTGLFDNARKECDFGNGRYVRNVIEKARVAQATRLLKMDFDSIKRKDLSILTAEDIEIPEPVIKTERKCIGFCV